MMVQDFALIIDGVCCASARPVSYGSAAMWQQSEAMQRRMQALQAEVDALARRSIQEERERDACPILSHMMNPSARGIGGQLLNPPSLLPSDGASRHGSLPLGESTSMLSAPMSYNPINPIRVDPGRSRSMRRDVISPMARPPSCGRPSAPSAATMRGPAQLSAMPSGYPPAPSGLPPIDTTPSTTDELNRPRGKDNISNGEAAELLLALSPKALPLSRSVSNISANGLLGFLDEPSEQPAANPAAPRLTPLPLQRSNTSGISVSGFLRNLDGGECSPTAPKNLPSPK